MKLSKLIVENFKKVARVELDLADINILVGLNGSGKSSVLQAVHLAGCLIRQADRVDANTTSTVNVEELDYLPTEDYKTLGHGAYWGNKSETPSSKIAITFSDEIGDYTSACEIRSARNAGISIKGNVPPEVAELLRRKRVFFSAYIPGISGIPNSEEKKSKKVVLKFCSYGDSNVILRNALLLLKVRGPENIELIERWIAKIAEPIRIFVDHDDDSDLSIRCLVEVGGVRRPLELLGTGYLQLIQIFTYVLLFGPKILLVDEPDIHLHPTVQERLVNVLAEVAAERNIRVLLTTHSPFVIRGARNDAKVYWMEGGRIASENRSEIELALGWGVFGKKLLIATEDSQTALIRKLISQWPDIERQITFVPGTGYKNLMAPAQVADLVEALGRKFSVLVYRDRDSLTDQEVANLEAQYAGDFRSVCFPELSDIESYFCAPAFLQTHFNMTEQQAIDCVQNLLQRFAGEIRNQFNGQRAAHNQELHRQGGSPTNDDVWAQFQHRSLKGAKGKFIFGQLKNSVPGNVFSENGILGLTLNGDIALDLKHSLERAIHAAP